MKKTALLTFVFVAASYPAVARHHFHHGQRATSSHSRISCEMVRAYVAQAGLAQAKAMAQAAGMTESEERQAVQCLEKRPAAVGPLPKQLNACRVIALAADDFLLDSGFIK